MAAITIIFMEDRSSNEYSFNYSLFDSYVYILEGKEPKAIPFMDISVWGEFLENGDRVVAHSEDGEVGVSTIFTGFNYAFGGGPPIVFETMIFGGEHDQYQWRYSTWDEAVAGHREACKLAGFDLSKIHYALT